MLTCAHKTCGNSSNITAPPQAAVVSEDSLEHDENEAPFASAEREPHAGTTSHDAILTKNVKISEIPRSSNHYRTQRAEGRNDSEKKHRNGQPLRAGNYNDSDRFGHKP